MKDQSLVFSEQTIQKIKDRELLAEAKRRGIRLDKETGEIYQIAAVEAPNGDNT